MRTEFWLESLKEGDRVLDIASDVQETGWQRVDWIDLGQDTDKWRAVVNTVMNLW